jgi:hypothetical protein
MIAEAHMAGALKQYFVLAAAAMLMQAGAADGIRPRPSASDYPAHETAGGITVAAAAIPADQVRKLFATDLNKAGYLVFEVAVYPEQGKTADLDSGDFMLKIGSDGDVIRAASPQAIASAAQRKNAPPAKNPHDVNVAKHFRFLKCLGALSLILENLGENKHYFLSSTSVNYDDNSKCSISSSCCSNS